MRPTNKKFHSVTLQEFQVNWFAVPAATAQALFPPAVQMVGPHWVPLIFVVRRVQKTQNVESSLKISTISDLYKNIKCKEFSLEAVLKILEKYW